MEQKSKATPDKVVWENRMCSCVSANGVNSVQSFWRKPEGLQ